MNELSYEPKSIATIVKTVLLKFVDATYEMIYEDIVNFYDGLVSEGFLEKAESFEECLNLQDVFFV